MDGLTTLADAVLDFCLLYPVRTASFACYRPIVGLLLMFTHCLPASTYLTAMLWLDSTHEPVCVHQQPLYGLDDLVGQLSLLFYLSCMPFSGLCGYLNTLYIHR